MARLNDLLEKLNSQERLVLEDYSIETLTTIDPSDEGKICICLQQDGKSSGTLACEVSNTVKTPKPGEYNRIFINDYKPKDVPLHTLQVWMMNRVLPIILGLKPDFGYVDISEAFKDLPALENFLRTQYKFREGFGDNVWLTKIGAHGC